MNQEAVLEQGAEGPETPELEAPGVPDAVDIRLSLPNKKSILLQGVSIGETFNAVRQALGDFQETAFITSFTWKFVSSEDSEGRHLDVESAPVSEFTELATFVLPGTKTCTFEVIEDSYDITRIRAHLKRLHDVIGRPYLFSTAARAPEEGDDKKKGDKPKKRGIEVPDISTVLQSPELGQYFNQAMCGSYEKMAVRAEYSKPAPLAEAIKNISISGWNPVPVGRTMRGDVMYIEVALAGEGTVYVTATAQGFYINRCSRHYFDPSPAAHPHFAHDLFTTLYGFAVSVQLAWGIMLEAAEVAVAVPLVPGPMDSLVDHYLSPNKPLAAHTWILPSASSGNPEDIQVAKRNAHAYDSVRAQQALNDLAGPEDLGAPREWNDEIQSIGSLKAQDFSEKIIKARLEYKIISDFTENVKAVAVAISEGRIAPLTFAESSQSDIFVYNGIFVNRAEDAKDAFKICEGEDACRKVTARAFSNEKIIRSLNIDGLTTVLCTIVDYKGVRYVGQSIIPGILTQGENSAQLLYGILDVNKPVTVKNNSLKIMREVAARLALTERLIPQYPYGEAAEAVPAEDKPTDPLVNLLSSVDAQASTIRVDTADDIEVADGMVPHVGPIEAKIIKGADGRSYLMEFMRLTPKDANYIPKVSAHIAEDVLADLETSSYVLRHELVNIFIQRKVNVARQQMLIEATEKEEEVKQIIEKKAAEAAAAAATAAAATVPATEEVDLGGGVQIVKEAATPADVDDSLLNVLATEYIEKFRSISPASLGIAVNPDAFIRPTTPEDEAMTVEMSTFLFAYVLPMVTKNVREGEFYPKDQPSLVTFLHRMGVNMRYLGALANLAIAQEKEDRTLLASSRQRVHSMPLYWFEFLLVEMIARVAKHLLNGAMRKNRDIAAAPAESIAAMLNHILSLLNAETPVAVEKVEKKTKKGPAAPAPLPTPAVSAAEKDKKKKKKTKQFVAVAPTADVVVGPANAFADRMEFFKDVAANLKSRFLFTLPLLSKALGVAMDAEGEYLRATLQARLSPVVLVRRIAQSCGFVIAGRNYDFKGVCPFKPEDILDILPKVKSFEPDAYLPEFAEFLNNSVTHLNSGNAVAAFECAQQAVNIIHQITGPNHLHAFQADDQLTAVLINSSEMQSALMMSSRCLTLCAQVQGLDCQDTVLHHMQLSFLHNETKNYKAALQHLLSARYLLQIIAGDRHPEMANILMRLAVLYDKAGDMEGAAQCLAQARTVANDLTKNCLIMMSMASLYHKHGRPHEALEFQKGGYKTLKELVVGEDEKLIEAKKNLEIYIRSAAAYPRIAPAQPVEAVPSPAVQDFGDLFNDSKDEAKKRKNSKKSKAKK